MKVKICGIRKPEEARKILSYKPDALGVIIGFPKHLAGDKISQYMTRKIVEEVSG